MIIRRLIVTCAGAVGLPAASRRLHPGRVVALLYHGVTVDAGQGVAAASGYTVSEQDLLGHITRLGRSCQFVRLSDVLAGRGLSRRRTNVLLTFDDGYETHWTRVFRQLQRRSIPALYALPTAFVGDHEPLWNDVVAYAIDASAVSAVRVHWQTESWSGALNERHGRTRLFEWAMATGLRIPQTQRAAFVQALVAALQVTATPEQLFAHEVYRPLRPEQLRAMAASGLAEFGSHTMHHYALPGLEPARWQTELVASKQAIEAMTQAPCRVLCVPAGRYDSRVLEAAFAAGYERVLTSDRQAIRPTAQVWGRHAVLSGMSQAELDDAVHGPLSDLACWWRTRHASRTTAGTMDDGTVQGYFDARANARTWQSLYDGPVTERTYNFATRRAAVRRMLAQVGPARRVLDVGCGSGDYAPMAHERGAWYCGLDFSAAMARAARARLAAMKGRSSVLVASGEAMPFPDGAFDGALAIGYLEYFDDPSAALSELQRVVRPGGVLVLQSYQREFWGRIERVTIDLFRPLLRRLLRRRAVQPPVDRLYTQRQLDRLLDGYGFERLAYAFNNFYVFPSPLRRVLPRWYMRVSEALGRGDGHRWRWLAVNYIGVYRRMGSVAAQPPAVEPADAQEALA